MRTPSRRLWLLWFMVLHLCPAAQSQLISVELDAGISDLTKGSDDPVSSWGNGWTVGFGGEFMPLSFLGITIHGGYHRFGFRGGVEFAGAIVNRESGNPMDVREFSVGLRLFADPFFLGLRRGSYRLNFGEVSRTYVESGSTTEKTSTWTMDPRITWGTAAEIGLRFEAISGIWLAPSFRVTMLSGVSPLMSALVVTVRKGLVE